MIFSTASSRFPLILMGVSSSSVKSMRLAPLRWQCRARSSAEYFNRLVPVRLWSSSTSLDVRRLRRCVPWPRLVLPLTLLMSSHLARVISLEILSRLQRDNDVLEPSFKRDQVPFQQSDKLLTKLDRPFDSPADKAFLHP